MTLAELEAWPRHEAGPSPRRAPPARDRPQLPRAAARLGARSRGKTKVLCTASLEESVPRWLSGKGRGWLTAEYPLLPASTGERTQREARSGRQQGRTVEIQRLIGRSVRAVADLEALGERTLWLDCDVLQADGGTRCAAISGVYVAAALALDRFGLSKTLTGSVAAVSVGVVDGQALLDVDYAEDSGAEWT